MKYIFARFFGWIFLIVGYWTAIGLIGIPLLILGRDLVLYADRRI